jgi:hypothetical protein
MKPRVNVAAPPRNEAAAVDIALMPPEMFSKDPALIFLSCRNEVARSLGMLLR